MKLNSSQLVEYLLVKEKAAFAITFAEHLVVKVILSPVLSAPNFYYFYDNSSKSTGSKLKIIYGTA